MLTLQQNGATVAVIKLSQQQSTLKVTNCGGQKARHNKTPIVADKKPPHKLQITATKRKKKFEKNDH